MDFQLFKLSAIFPFNRMKFTISGTVFTTSLYLLRIIHVDEILRFWDIFEDVTCFCSCAGTSLKNYRFVGYLIEYCSMHMELCHNIALLKCSGIPIFSRQRCSQGGQGARGAKEPWLPRVFNIYDRFVLWEAMSQTKYYCSLKFKINAPPPKPFLGCFSHPGLYKLVWTPHPAFRGNIDANKE